MLMEKSKDNANSWKGILCSYIGRISVVKMTIQCKEIYEFNAIPIKLPMTFCPQPEQNNFEFVWKKKQPKKS